ncbi:RHS repeat-associated core domain-containing protein [Nocardiopsis sp. CNT312]|uniref:RHS repeat-associated core domain-containing protein n=1 Tax=Nocardiopsis sp. CNT312 TaxID=1137268 RepID=UPI0004B36977|nr:RHS repeat-associated core domain-containing protein [Nocardiopsis sp. CNT312]
MVYSKVGDLMQREFYRGILGSERTWQTFDYEEATRRLSLASVVHQLGDGSLSTKTYDYDDVGNLLRISDEPTSTQAPDDVQCFDYDHLRRLTQAWTPDAVGETACDTEPEGQQIGGADPYWHSYTYDETGNRVEEIQYAVIGGGQTVRSYAGPQEGQGPAHGVASVTEDGAGGTTEHTYDYDAAGNMVSRTTGERDQVLEWGPEGELVSVTDGLEVTEYVYDADGERLLRRANGATTLYLPGAELTWDPPAGTLEATRYYTHAEETVAVREDGGDLHWVFSDHHGTGQIAVDAEWGDVAQRRTTAFGQARSASGVWPGERGFVDGTIDASTGLTQLGARAYDADLGRFVSVDPVMDLTDDQQMHGYAYANNNPVSFSDPTGLQYVDPWSIYMKDESDQSSSVDGWQVAYYMQGLIPSYHGQSAASKQSSGSFSGGTIAGASASASVSSPSPYSEPVSATVDPHTQANNEARWWDEAWDSAAGWGGSAMDWVSENWDGIYNWLTVASLLVCIAATAGACVVAGGALLAANIAVDAYDNRNDLSQMDVTGHVTDAAMLAAGGVVARTVAGTGSRFWRDHGFSRLGRYQRIPEGRKPKSIDIGSTAFIYGVNAAQWVVPQGVGSATKWMFGDMGARENA